MFDITAKLVGEQDEINNLDNIHWGRNSWKQLSLIGDETVINLPRTTVYVFSDSVLCFGKIHQHPESNEAWKKRIEKITTSQWTIQSVVKNHESLTLKQTFDVTAQLVNNQEDISCVDKILWRKNSWTRLSLIDDEIVINLQRTNLCILGFCVVSRKSSSTYRIQRSLEEPGCRNPIREKLQRS